MNGAVDGSEELPEDRGGTVAEDSAVSAGEDGGHEASMEVRGSVTDGVDAAVEAMKVALAKAPGDRVIADANLTELARGDDAMLSRRDLSEVSPRSVAFFPHGWE